jgi:hypothetical protein
MQDGFFGSKLGGGSGEVEVDESFIGGPEAGFLTCFFFFFGLACRIAVANRSKFANASGPSVYSRCFIYSGMYLQATFSIFLDIFYALNYRRFDESGVFQQPRLMSTTDAVFPYTHTGNTVWAVGVDWIA